MVSQLLEASDGALKKLSFKMFLCMYRAVCLFCMQAMDVFGCVSAGCSNTHLPKYLHVTLLVRPSRPGCVLSCTQWVCISLSLLPVVLTDG